MNPTVIQLARQLAQQEARALRAYARYGPPPKTRPLKLPWHPNYINTAGWLTPNELLPDHKPRKP